MWNPLMWATSMVHFSKSIASQLGRLPLMMGYRRRRKGMQQRRRHIHAAASPCCGSDGRTQSLAAAVARAEASWLLRDLQHALNTRDEAAMSRVGSMLMAGYGTKQDPEEAALWMREAWALQNFYDFEVGGPAACGTLCTKPTVATSPANHDARCVGELHHHRQHEQGQLQHAHTASRPQAANPQDAGQCVSAVGGCHCSPKDSQHAGHQSSTKEFSGIPCYPPKDSQDAGPGASAEEGPHQAPYSACSIGTSTSERCSPPAGHQSAHSPLLRTHGRDVCEQQRKATVAYGGVLGEPFGGGDGSRRWGEHGSSEPSTEDYSTDEERAESSAHSLQGSLVSLARGLPTGQLLGTGTIMHCTFKVAHGGSGRDREDEQQSLGKLERLKHCEEGTAVDKDCSGDQLITCQKFAAEWPQACLFQTPMRGKRRRMSV